MADIFSKLKNLPYKQNQMKIYIWQAKSNENITYDKNRTRKPHCVFGP